jgi:TRAP-type C4-dicarboxylate transport system permease small subunit
MSNLYRLLNRVSMAVAGFSIIALILECNLNIIGRYVRKPIPGSYDILSLGVVFVIAASLLPVELSGGHVVVSNITSRLFKSGMIRKIYDVIMSIINLFIVLWLLGAIVYHLAAVSIPGNERAMTLQVICAPFRIAWALGVLLLALGILKKTLEIIWGKGEK